MHDPALKATADRQYLSGMVNRRIMRAAQALDRGFADVTAEPGAVDVLCACGREGCRELVRLPLEKVAEVKATPHRFVIAPGHAAPIDAVVDAGEGFEIVELQPEYRVEHPPTAEDN